ncbi:unnamed protein product, partial [Closterium sp. NIES-53]
MDWWRVIVTSPRAYEPPSQEEEPTGPAVTWSSLCETAQCNTRDAWCAGLQARFEPIAASISAHHKLRTWRQLGSVQDYTNGFLALCEQVRYMHEAEWVDRYVDGLKLNISPEIMLRGLSKFNEILALAEKIDILRRPRPGSYYGHRPQGTTEHATVHAVAANAAVAPFKGRCFSCNRPGHCKSECPEEQRRRGAEQGRESQRQGNASREAEQPSDFQKLLAAIPPELQELLKRYPRIFPEDLPEGLPPQRAHDHHIELEPGAHPTVQRQFRLTQHELDELRKQLDNLLEKKNHPTKLVT